MSLHRLLLTTALAALGTAATAQVTADDVWAAITATYEAMGAEMEATVTRDGNIVTLSGIRGTYVLPMDLGSFSLQTGPVVMTENADGTVSVETGANWPIYFWAEVDDGFGPASLKLTLNQQFTGAVTTVSGTPDAVRIQQTYDRLALSIADVAAGGVAQGEIEASDFDMLFTIDGATVDATISGAAGTGPITLAYTSVATGVSTRFEIGDEADFSSVSESSVQMLNQTGSIVLPRTGLDLLNLSPALRDGLALNATLSNGLSTSSQIASSFGEVMTASETSVGFVSQTLRLDANGVELTGTATDMTYGLGGMMGLIFGVSDQPMDLKIGSLTGRILIPLLARPEAQEAAFSINMTDADLGAPLWNLLAPSAEGLHQPADLTFSSTVQVRIRKDLLDFIPLGEQLSRGEVVAEFQSFSAALAPLEWAGATVEGAIQGTFDWEGINSYDALQAPTGSGTARITGGNALLDLMGQAGFIPPGELAAVRAFLNGMFKPAGEDVLESTVTFDQSGFFLNGQLMPL
jgi:hypothetical protein